MSLATAVIDSREGGILTPLPCHRTSKLQRPPLGSKFCIFQGELLSMRQCMCTVFLYHSDMRRHLMQTSRHLVSGISDDHSDPALQIKMPSSACVKRHHLIAAILRTMYAHGRLMSYIVSAAQEASRK